MQPRRIVILILGTAFGVVSYQSWMLRTMYFYLGGIYLVIAVALMITQRKFTKALIAALIGHLRDVYQLGSGHRQTDR